MTMGNLLIMELYPVCLEEQLQGKLQGGKNVPKPVIFLGSSRYLPGEAVPDGIKEPV
jgi:hypothetical protein